MISKEKSCFNKIKAISKYWYDICFWVVFIGMLGGMFYLQYYTVFPRNSVKLGYRRILGYLLDEIFLQNFRIHVVYTLIIMLFVFFIGYLLREHMNIGTSTVVVTIFIILWCISDKCWNYLASAINMLSIVKRPIEQLDFFFYLDPTMFMLIRGTGIGICLLYLIGRTGERITCSKLCKVTLITGIISFILLFRYSSSFTSQYYKNREIIQVDLGIFYGSDAIIYLYEIAIFCLLLPILYWASRGLVNTGVNIGEEDKKRERSYMGMTLIIVAIISILVAKDRVIDFGEGGSILLLEEYLKANLSWYIMYDISALLLIMVIQLGIIFAASKLKQRKYFIGVALVIGIIQYIYYDIWMHSAKPIPYDVCKFLNLGWERGHTIYRTMIFFNPIQFFAVLLLVEYIRKKANSKWCASIKMSGSVILTVLIAFLARSPKYYMKGNYLRYENIGIWEYSTFLNIKISIKAMSLLAFLCITVILIAVGILLLLIKHGKFIRPISITEMIIDASFVLMIILTGCYYFKVDYDCTISIDRENFSLGVRSFILNTCVSVLIFLGTVLAIKMMKKINNKIMDGVMGILSILISSRTNVLFRILLFFPIGKKLMAYAAKRPNANGCFVMLEGSIKGIAIGIILFIVLRLIKKKITATQVGILVSTLNFISISCFTLGRNNFYKICPFHEPLYTFHSDFDAYHTIFFAIGLIPIYLVIKAVFFNKTIKFPTLQKKEIIPILGGIVVVSIIFYLVYKINPLAIKLIISQLYYNRLYLAETAILSIVMLGGICLGHIINKKCFSIEE